MKTLGFVAFVSCTFFLLIYALTGAASHQLRISAVGRFASLGEVYDIRNDIFTGENIFADLPPQDQNIIEVTTLERKTTKTQIVRSLLEKVKLIGIELPQAVNILDGSILPKGTSKYLLHSKNDVKFPEAATFHSTETLKVTLKLYRKSIAPIIDQETLERSLGTHVVVGISYGMNAIFNLKATSNEIYQDHQQKQLLETVEDLPAKYNQTLNENFKFKIFSDIDFPQKYIQEFDDISAMVRSILNNTDQGKGVPLKYFLLPLEQIKNYFGIQNLSSNFTPIEGILLEKVLKNFENVIKTRDQLHSEPKICYSKDERNILQNLTDNFEKTSENFQSDVKRTLTLISNGELGKSSLTELLDSFKASPYSPRNVFESFQTNILESLTTRNSVCKTLVDNGIEYMQKHINMVDVIFQTRKKPLFTLLFNSSLISSDISSWQENFNLLFKLKKPWNRALAIDCVIHEDACRDMNGTSIRQYLNLELISNNLLEDLTQNQNAPPSLQIPAIGTPRQLGDLYDATSGTFLDASSIFQRKQTFSLMSELKNRSVMYPSIVTSNKWQKFLQDLKIPHDQKLLMLRKESVTQNGLLKNFNSIRNHPQSLQKFLLQTSIYEEEYLNFEAEQENWPSQISQQSFQSPATHFVEKIYKGSTTLIGIIHPNPEQKQIVVDRMKIIFDENLNCIENQISQNLTNLFENIDPLTKFLILSDDQDSTPGKIYDLQKFQQFLISYSLTNKRKNPVAYVLHPLLNFQGKFGLLPKIPKIPNPLSPDTSDKILAALDLLEDTSTQFRVLSWKDQMFQNSECFLKMHHITFDTFAKNFENTTKFWTAELNSLLDNYRKRENDDHEQIFLNFIASFKESNSEFEEQETKIREVVSTIKEKIIFCKFCRESSVKYITNSNDYTSVLLGDAGEERIYLMFYRQEWVQTMRDIWFQNHVKFFQTLPNLKRELGNNSTSSSRRYLVDCDFFTDASDNICANISRPIIHEYKNGLLVSQDVDSSLRQEEISNHELLEDLQMSQRNFFSETTTNFNSINFTLNNLRGSQELLIPIGFVYIQYKNQPTPVTLWPSYNWEDISSAFAGEFFRVVGGGSGSFGSTQAGNAPRITQVNYADISDHPTVVSLPVGGISEYVRTAWYYGSHSDYIGLAFTTSGGEVRPYNSAVKVWKRIS